VAKELKKRGWMFNKKFNTFFQLQGNAKNRTDDLIEGKFKFFDYEQDWIIRQKKDFKFDLKFLDNID
jgi:CCR4-NOT transcriptional regulation complex NOT5 subunit